MSARFQPPLSQPGHDLSQLTSPRPIGEIIQSTDSPRSLLEALRIGDAVYVAKRDLESTTALNLYHPRKIEALCEFLSTVSATGAYHALTTGIVEQARATLETKAPYPEYLRGRLASVWVMTLTALLTHDPNSTVLRTADDFRVVDHADEVTMARAKSFHEADILKVVTASRLEDMSGTDEEKIAAFHRIFLSCIDDALLGRHQAAYATSKAHQFIVRDCYKALALFAPERARLLLAIYHNYRNEDEVSVWNFDKAFERIPKSSALGLLAAEQKGLRHQRAQEFEKAFDTYVSALATENSSPLATQMKSTIFGRLDLLLLSQPDLGNHTEIQSQYGHLLLAKRLTFDAQRLLLHPDTWGAW